MKQINCLLDIEEEDNIETIEQFVLVSISTSLPIENYVKEVEFLIYRNYQEGGNINKVGNYFENIPYLNNNKKCYDLGLSILEQAFTPEIVTEYNIDQILYDMDVNDEKTITIELPRDITESTEAEGTELPEVELTYKLLENDIEPMGDD